MLYRPSLILTGEYGCCFATPPGKRVVAVYDGAYKLKKSQFQPELGEWSVDLIGTVYLGGSPSDDLTVSLIELGDLPDKATPNLTGGSSDYYKVQISRPTTPGTLPYTTECNDIIEALGLNFAEGNILKALWRIAAARLGRGKPGVSMTYDAEKVKFFAERVLAQNAPIKETPPCHED